MLGDSERKEKAGVLRRDIGNMSVKGKQMAYIMERRNVVIFLHRRPSEREMEGQGWR